MDEKKMWKQNLKECTHNVNLWKIIFQSEFENELVEAEKEFLEKLSSIESSKKDEMENLREKHRSRERALDEGNENSQLSRLMLLTNADSEALITVE